MLIREDIRRMAGHAIVCGFDGTSVTAELRELVREARPLGLILFRRNIESTEQLYELTRELKSLRPTEPLLLAVDQEGGRVERLPAPATHWPSMGTLGATGDVALVRRVGEAIGREVRALGFDVDFAPVLDVHTRADNPVIGDRALGSDPERVGELGVALIEGLTRGGVGACGKHFPGHGDTSVDSHLALPYVEHDLARLRAIEWKPFARAIAAGLEAVMSAHVVVTGLDEDHPATLSPKVLSHLRETLGFGGVVFSDDIEMKALADHYAVDDIARRGAQAGIDVFLPCHLPEVTLELYGALVRAMESEVLAADDRRASETRVLGWYHKSYAPPVAADVARSVVGAGAHSGLAQEIAARAERAVS